MTMLRQNTPDYRLSLEGRNLGLADNGTVLTSLLAVFAAGFMAKIGPRMVSLKLTEYRDGQADQLDLTLADHDSQLAIPTPGQVIALQLGWKGGADVSAGLIDKGRFKVDEAEWSGPPDTITIRARSADFTAAFAQRRENSHVGTTVQAIMAEIAGAHGLALRIDGDLASRTIPVIEQDELSDAALLRILGRRMDAAATVKNGTLIFTPIGGRTDLGPVAITRASGDSCRYTRGERGQYDGVEARWHDKASGTRKSVIVGSDTPQGDADGQDTDDREPKRLKKIYASETSARDAARAALAKMDRASAEFKTTLALGRPDIFPERPATLAGFKAEVDARAWLVGECEHSLDDSGLVTRLKLEAG